MLFENIKIAFSNFVTNKLRTLLSLLGILIGVASVIVITTLGNSATSNIQDEISGAGMDLVVVYGGWGGARSQQVFSADLGKNLEAELPNIIASTPAMLDSVIAKSRYTENSFNLNVITPSYMEVFGINVVAGRFFSSEDSHSRFPGVVLGYETAKRLFPTGGAVGSPLKLLFGSDAFQVEVLGILEERDAAMGNSFNDVILMDLNYYSGKIGKVEVVTSFFLKALDPQKAAIASNEVKEYLGRKITEKDGFWVDSPSSLAKMFKEVTNTMNMVLAGIAAISLLVGGIGIMNIMLVSVTERTREIGIRKALGAPARMIRLQFLTESATLTVVGGIVGSLVGFGLGWFITGAMKWKFSPDFRAFGLAIAVSVVIGIFFGIYPAIRASKLNPIQALSYE